MDQSGSAFPIVKGHYHCEGQDIVTEGQVGLTKREYFAIQALIGILAREESFGCEKNVTCAVQYADEMLRQLEAGNVGDGK